MGIRLKNIKTYNLLIQFCDKFMIIELLNIQKLQSNSWQL